MPAAMPAFAIFTTVRDHLRQLEGEGANESARFYLARWLFLRLLGVVYLSAFLSFGSQVQGLVGSQGILPAARYLEEVKSVIGPERYYLLPTLCWIDCSDVFLNRLCLAGAALAILLIAGAAPVPVLFLLWACYLSLSVAGQSFMRYQWDALLLETGLLAIFFAPGGLWPRLSQERPPSRVVRWLLWFLLLRLVFMSGLVKLATGDPTWRHLTALQYHYETQPLPPWTSWYMHQLPAWFQKLSVMVTFVLELLVPLLIFLPRRRRHVGFVGLVGLQLLIAATGNYGFFNLLTVALCMLLLDDAVFPARVRAWLPKAGGSASGSLIMGARWAFAVGIALLTVAPFLKKLQLLEHSPRWLSDSVIVRNLQRGLSRAEQVATSFSAVNSYGLFAVMTTRRHEIVIEGSDDGKSWLAYEFKWKPGDVRRRPEFVPLHMPRLDWQMWFAALGDYRQNPWLGGLVHGLLKGSPEVLALLEHNPFPDHPPHFLRAVVYDYHFTTPAERSGTGAWWKRERLGLYYPVVSLKDRQ